MILYYKHDFNIPIMSDDANAHIPIQKGGIRIHLERANWWAKQCESSIVPKGAWAPCPIFNPECRLKSSIKDTAHQNRIKLRRNVAIKHQKIVSMPNYWDNKGEKANI